jgi:FtsZ-binding cell division protein ZapB
VSVDETLARWAQRDAAIGLDAELAEVRVALAAHDSEIADLRERNERLAQRVAQLVVERDGLARQVASLQRPVVTQRVYRRARSLAGRVVRSVRH